MEKIKAQGLSAAETREATESSEFLMRLAFKLILEASNRNEVSIELDIRNKSRIVVNKLIEELEKKGYEVKYYEIDDPEELENPKIDPDCLVISW